MLRDAPATLTRDERRALLERELGANESPLWIENALDQAEQPREVSGLQALFQLGRLAAQTVRIVRDPDSIPDSTPPPWLDPPQWACYPAADLTPDSWVAVQLDPGASAWLASAHESVPAVSGSVALTAWLQRRDHGTLEVSLGRRCVGTLGDRDAARFADVESRATFREELVRTAARLTPRPQRRFLLELGAPPGS
jgi:hypothetical protein